MTVNDTTFFVKILNTQIIKRRIVVPFERKEGRRRFYLALKKVVKGSGFVEGKVSSK